MIKLLLTALKIFLLLALALAVGFGALLLADSMHWPRWIVGVAVAGVFFVVVLVLFLRRYYYRRREEKFVKRVVDQDQASIQAAPAHERRRLQELQDRWTAAVATLRASRLRHRGDPLYTLPWFMIFGETASGKSTAVSHARLTSILTDVGPTKGIASTKNCDWWFFENAVVLDTAGRYAVPLEEEDREEWERFLTLMARYRRKEPLNGLIVTLPADRLLTDEEDALVAYGRSIRMRMDQLMRVLGARFPVYVLVTKLDLVMGMTALAELLPAGQRVQAMGLLNDREKRAPEEFLGEAVGHISRRLKDLRLLLAGGASGGRAALFPDEFERLTPRIRAFIQGAFHENPYQETPFFRGLFISSGRQSGLARSGVLGSLESFKDRQWRLPDTALGLFLHDFFSAILPKDRFGFRMLGEYLSWRTATTNLALGAWMLLLLTLIGLSSLSYVQIHKAIQPVYEAFPQAPAMGADLAQDMVSVGLMRDRIARMQNDLHTGIWPRMGFYQGQAALTGLKGTYNTWFRDAILTPTDEAMGQKFVNLGVHDQEDVLAPYLEYLVWRIDTLKAREAGKPRSDQPGQDGPIQALALAFGGRLPYVAAFFPDMYRSYAVWEGDVGILSRERQEMQMWANRIIEIEGQDLHWLADWAAARPNLHDVTLNDFWIGLGQVHGEPRVSRAYTRQGVEEVQKLLAQVALTAADPEAFTRRKQAFWQWYAKQFDLQWDDFLHHFDLGMDKLVTRDDWLRTSAGMATLDNPYFNLIWRLRDEYSAIRNILYEPKVVELTERNYREFEFLVENFRAKQMGSSLDARISEKIRQLEARVFNLEDSLAAVEHFQTYMEQLKALQQVTTSMDVAYRFASQEFGMTGNVQSPEDIALAAADTISHLLVKGMSAENIEFWNIVKGPLYFLVTMITYETACAVNDLWESQVLAETTNIPSRELWTTLFGDQGVVPAFLTGTSKPYLRRTQEGWAPMTWLDVPFPFRQEFLTFLDQGSVRRQQLQPKYVVPVTTLPTNVNVEAKSEPYQTTLTLQCAAQPQTLDNFNFPNSLDFAWEPATCDDVNLRIYFREATLSRTWAGEWGFRDFLRDFRAGRKVYAPDDFPQQKSILEGLGVSRIQVNYTMRNVDPILAIQDLPPLRVPSQAAYCYAGLGAGGLRPGAVAGTGQDGTGQIGTGQIGTGQTGTGPASQPAPQAAPQASPQASHPDPESSSGSAQPSGEAASPPARQPGDPADQAELAAPPAGGGQ